MIRSFPVTSFLKCLILISTIVFKSYSQTAHFRNPLDIPIRLSANFGDIRDDHYHTGLDIRTNEKTGLKVYAAASGYVSRIKVSPYGYGNVLYITHPDGYITVYAHLDHFSDSIAKYVKKQQYASKKFEVDLYPSPKLFRVKQGDVIARSGNSGGSSGPHLHFEIRDVSGETFPLNPEKFLPVEDSLPPKFNGLYIYSLSSAGEIPVPQQHTIIDTDNIPRLVEDTIDVHDDTIGMGVDVEDFMNSSKSDLGVYQLEGFKDSLLFFSMKFDRLSFDNGRYVNAHVDYRIWQLNDTLIRKLFLLPGDHNSLYDGVKNRGKIFLADTAVHDIRLQATDENGNTASLNFHIRFSGEKMISELSSPVSAYFLCGQPNTFKQDSMILSLPANALYSDLNFNYAVTDSGTENYLSGIHHISDRFTPLHEPGQLKLLPRFIADSLKKKAVIVYMKGPKRFSALTTHQDENYLAASIHYFGDYTIMIDTVPPVVAVIGLRQNHYLKRTVVRFLAADNLSGLDSYNGYLDGKWILLEYNAKADQLICNIDRPFTKGNHHIRVVAADEVGNKTTYTFNFKK